MSPLAAGAGAEGARGVSFQQITTVRLVHRLKKTPGLGLLEKWIVSALHLPQWLGLAGSGNRPLKEQPALRSETAANWFQISSVTWAVVVLCEWNLVSQSQRLISSLIQIQSCKQSRK